MSKGTFAARLHLHGMCSVSFPAGAPAFNWQTGAWTTAFVDNAAGDVTLTYGADYAIDSTQVAYFGQVNAAIAASGNTTLGVVHVTDTTCRVTIGVEAGAGGASVLTDLTFFLQAWKLQP